MKKLSLIILALAVVLAPSCKNFGKKKVAEAEKPTNEVSVQEQYVTAEFQYNLEQLIESTSQMNQAPFVTKTANGDYSLTDKEKMLKPDYLLPTDNTDSYITLSQKYRAMAMLAVDKMIADLYGMDINSYDAAMTRIGIDINDDAMRDFGKSLENKDITFGDAVKEFSQKEYEAGKAPLFWEAVTASLVEQLYVITKNINKFMPMFTDESASEITYNFVCVHENLTQLISFYPEMKSLNSILAPLYVINAISVDQLKSQLTELKGEIEVIRALLLN